MILASVLSDGLAAVEAACAKALASSVHSADVVLNILARRRDPAPVVTVLTPEALRLRQAPLSDCARYDSPTCASSAGNGTGVAVSNHARDLQNLP